VDFSISEDQRELVSSTRRLLAERSPAEAVRRIAEDDAADFDPQVWRLGSDLGWPALLVPEAHGGLGRDLTDLVLVTEEWGRCLQPGPLIGNAIATFAIAQSAPAALAAAVLPQLASGERTATPAFAEPGGEWDVRSVATQATRTAGGYLLSGTKTHVLDAGSARWLVVAAQLDGVVTQFLVERPTPGLSVRRLRTLDITRRLDVVRFDNVLVPFASRLDPTTADLERQLAVAAVLISADSIGVAGRLLEMSVEYAKLRVQFGRPIGSFQVIKHKCARMRMALQASVSATYYAGMALAATATDADEAARVAKAFSSEAVCSIAGEALQLHGGVGFTWEHDLHLFLRRARGNSVLFGAPYLHYEHLFQQLEERV
jgi:alkylation response protein AidB-like acyl-CoA dehydrogenase